jgi:hypothetical protein
MMQLPIVPTRRVGWRGRRKDTVEHADLKLTHEQAASELGGPSTPSHGHRLSQAVDEAGVHQRAG